MSIKKQVVEAQAKIINNLILCEESISDLYLMYSTAVPEMADFWSDLARKEKIHADLLKTMHKQLEQGHLFQNIGKFDEGSVDSFLKMINDAAAKVKKGNVTALDAIETSLAVESSILDAHFYDIVKSEAAEYKVIAERLSADTHDHVRAVQAKLQEIQLNS